MNITELTVCELQEKLKNKELTISEIVDSYCNRINEKEPEVNAFITTYLEEAKNKAKELEKNQTNGEYTGIPIGIKDNICIKGTRTTCASKMLEDFVAPYSATIAEKIDKEIHGI